VALDEDGRAVDFHLVASNEAWYRKSCEMEQMVAFSRLIALSTGRSVVRATNSGISMVLGPDGRELGRVRAPDGSYRMVKGWGAWTVPVPAPGAPAATPYARSFRVQRAAWILLAVGAAMLPVARRNRKPSAG
jgi:apolipoprotein N-acyltransferase